MSDRSHNTFLSQSNLFLSGRFHLDYKQLNTLKTDTYYMVDFLLTLISWLCPLQALFRMPRNDATVRDCNIINTQVKQMVVLKYMLCNEVVYQKL
jgi:hypothetical protein